MIAERISGIYVITNLINKKQYVGQSVDIYKRWQSHKYAYNSKSVKKYGQVIYKAFKKYGIENFDFQIIEECEPDKLNEREIFWINKLNTYHNGYNSTLGGDGARWSSANFSKELSLQLYEDLKNVNIDIEDLSEKYNLSAETLNNINKGNERYNDKETYPLRVTYCIDCGKRLDSILSDTCLSCKNRKAQQELRGTVMPDKQTLKQLIFEKTFVEVGKIYKVSDKCVVKWCNIYGLPWSREEIDCYTESEWDDNEFNDVPYIPYKYRQLSEKVFKDYLNGTSLIKLTKKYKRDYDTIKRMLILNGAKIRQPPSLEKTTFKLDKDTLQILNIYPSISEAQRQEKSTTIGEVIIGHKKTSAGFKWAVIEDKEKASQYKIGDMFPEEYLPKYTRMEKAHNKKES